MIGSKLGKNRFFTVLVVPEKTHLVRRFVLPSYAVYASIVALLFVTLVGIMMILDYTNVLNQIAENRRLRTENDQLRQNMQQLKDQMLTVESTLDRIRSFATKLKIVTNLDIQRPESNSSSDRSNFSPSFSNPVNVPPLTPPYQRNMPSDPRNPQPDYHDEPELPRQLEESFYEGPQTRLKRMFTDLDDKPTLPSIDEELGIFSRAFRYLISSAQAQELDIQNIYEGLSDKRDMLMSMPMLMPTDGEITSPFGIRISPYEGRRKMHEGVDIANRYGADIIAPGNGRVTFAGYKAGYGKILSINHGYGLKSFYGHISAFFVEQGQQVTRGQRIAAIGNTGRSTGPHVHYEIHAKGLPIDPKYYMLDR